MANELAAVGTNTKVALREGKTWGDVVRAALRDELADAAPQAKPPVAKPVKLSAKDTAALQTMATKLDAVVWPSDRRKLNKTELKSMLELFSATKDLKSLVERLEKGEKPVFFNHFDVIAETRDDNPATPAEAPRNGDGFYALEDKENGAVDGLEVKATREVSAATVQIDVERLFDLVQAGKLSRETFRKMTKRVLAVDEDGVMAEIKADPTLIPIVKEATVITRAASVSLNLRKNG